MSSLQVKPRGKHIALYVPTLTGGGAEANVLRLARYYVSEGFRVDLVVNRKQGAYARQIPEHVRLVELKSMDRRPARSLRARLLVLRARPSALFVLVPPVLLAWKPVMDLRYLPALIKYLRAAEPGIMICALTQANLLGIWAKILVGSKFRLVVSEHTTLSKRIALEMSKPGLRWRWKYLPGLIRRFYPQADAIVAVSDACADDLAELTGLSRSSITTVYNPVVDDVLMELAARPLSHPWFRPDQPPVILAVGLLSPNKGFSTLIRAFALLAQRRPARLVILGEGPDRQHLQELAGSLKIEREVDFPGWVDNPYNFMAKAGVFVMSSEFEGFSLVLVEALACGCPVVSTDCPSGPHEILDDGKYGRLVPVGDAQSMADAMERTLKCHAGVEFGKKRAAQFSVAASAQAYLKASGVSGEQGVYQKTAE